MMTGGKCLIRVFAAPSCGKQAIFVGWKAQCKAGRSGCHFAYAASASLELLLLSLLLLLLPMFCWPPFWDRHKLVFISSSAFCACNSAGADALAGNQQLATGKEQLATCNNVASTWFCLGCVDSEIRCQIGRCTPKRIQTWIISLIGACVRNSLPAYELLQIWWLFFWFSECEIGSHNNNNNINNVGADTDADICTRFSYSCSHISLAALVDQYSPPYNGNSLQITWVGFHFGIWFE